MLIFLINMLPSSKSLMHPLNYIKKQLQVILVQIVILFIKHQNLTIKWVAIYFLYGLLKKNGWCSQGGLF
jgi:hypothetical protein